MTLVRWYGAPWCAIGPRWFFRLSSRLGPLTFIPANDWRRGQQ